MDFDATGAKADSFQSIIFISHITLWACTSLILMFYVDSDNGLLKANFQKDLFMQSFGQLNSHTPASSCEYNALFPIANPQRL